jgi:hypothetical protein
MKQFLPYQIPRYHTIQKSQKTKTKAKTNKQKKPTNFMHSMINENYNNSSISESEDESDIDEQKKILHRFNLSFEIPRICRDLQWIVLRWYYEEKMNK